MARGHVVAATGHAVAEKDTLGMGGGLSALSLISTYSPMNMWNIGEPSTLLSCRDLSCGGPNASVRPASFPGSQSGCRLANA